jgi:hypothetical protein
MNARGVGVRHQTDGKVDGEDAVAVGGAAGGGTVFPLAGRFNTGDETLTVQNQAVVVVAFRRARQQQAVWLRASERVFDAACGFGS